MEKKGQVTLFVIIAMIIVVAGALVFTLSGTIRSSSDIKNNPRLFLKDCVEDDFEELAYGISMNGGSIDPEFYHDYYGNKVEYLCSSSEPYSTCVVQRPFLEAHIIKELEKGIDAKVKSCVEALELNFKEKGFQVTSELKGHSVLLNPNRLSLDVDYELTLSKTESTRYTDFMINLNNNLYELVGVARSIIEWEALWGDAEVSEYSAIYQHLDIRKNRVSDDAKVYTIEDKKTKDRFQFASRSMVFPSGMI